MLDLTDILQDCLSSGQPAAQLIFEENDPFTRLQFVPTDLLHVANTSLVTTLPDYDCAVDELDERASAKAIPCISSRASIEYVEQSVCKLQKELQKIKREALLAALLGGQDPCLAAMLLPQSVATEGG